MRGPITIASGWLPTTPAESVTCTVKLLAPFFVGVPVMAPVERSSASPGGRFPVPVSAQRYGGVPPVAESFCEYAVPIWPLASEVVVMISCGAMVRVKFLDTDALVESVNCSVNP